jgi:hypothetical protein
MYVMLTYSSKLTLGSDASSPGSPRQPSLHSETFGAYSLTASGNRCLVCAVPRERRYGYLCRLASGLRLLETRSRSSWRRPARTGHRGPVKPAASWPRCGRLESSGLHVARQRRRPQGSTQVPGDGLARLPRHGYLLLRRSLMIASRASMISSREARLLLKLSLRLNALVGGRKAKTKCFGRPA